MKTTILSNGDIIKTWGNNIDIRHRHAVHISIYVKGLEDTDKDKIDYKYYDSDIEDLIKVNNILKKD